MDAPVCKLWAVIYRTVAGTECIQAFTIRRTRKEAWAAYCQVWTDADHVNAEKRAGRVRLARVVARLA